jgi:hypothetical protein
MSHQRDKETSKLACKELSFRLSSLYSLSLVLYLLLIYRLLYSVVSDKISIRQILCSQLLLISQCKTSRLLGEFGLSFYLTSVDVLSRRYFASLGLTSWIVFTISRLWSICHFCQYLREWRITLSFFCVCVCPVNSDTTQVLWWIQMNWNPLKKDT